VNRRSFIGNLIGGLAAGAAVRTWPFRVYSFAPSVRVPELIPVSTDLLNLINLEDFGIPSLLGIENYPLIPSVSWNGLYRPCYPGKLNISNERS